MQIVLRGRVEDTFISDSCQDYQAGKFLIFNLKLDFRNSSSGPKLLLPKNGRVAISQSLRRLGFNSSLY